MDCYTGSDTGVVFLSEAAVVNLSDTLQQRLKRLAQVFIESLMCTVELVTLHLGKAFVFSADPKSN